MIAYIKTEVSLHECTEYGKDEGRHFLRYKPFLESVVCCSGNLSFPAYEAWLDEPHTHASQRQAAIANAELALQKIAEELNRAKN